MGYSEKIRVFLARHDMEPESVDMERVTAAFLADMQLGLAGRDSSLAMIPTYLTADGALPNGRAAAVIDAGGTNFRTALVSFGDEGSCISDLAVANMPGSRTQASWDEFIDFAARQVRPLLERAETLGFCFSYPVEALPNRDGRVIRLGKEVRLSGCEGRLLCADLAARLAELGVGERRFVSLNDTPAVLLSGVNRRLRGDYAALVGLICGTGTNTCCAVPSASVKKLDGGFDGNMLINLESGWFAGLPRGEYDAVLDAASVEPGNCRHEKMTSGAYVGELCRLMLRGAAEDGLFTSTGAKTVLSLGAMTTPIADSLAEGASGHSLFADEGNLAVASQLCRAAFERAARCVCCNLSAILTLTGCGGTDRPALICVDGSVYKKSRAFRPMLERYMEEFTLDVLGVGTEFYTTDNATILGSAAAALLNTKEDN